MACAAWGKSCQQKWSISDLSLNDSKMQAQHGDTNLNMPIRRLRLEGLEFKASPCMEGDPISKKEANKQRAWDVATRLF